MVARARKHVRHFFFLGSQVIFVFGAGFHFNGNPLHNFDAVARKAHNLFGIVGEQTNLVDTKIHKHLRARAVVAQIGGDAQLAVGFHSVVALILQGIGLDFVGKADAASFLTHIEHCTAPFFFNLVQGRTQLSAAVAAQRAKRITREAFAVNAGEHRFRRGKIALYQGQMRTGFVFAFVSYHGKVAKTGGQMSLGHAAHRNLTTVKTVQEPGYIKGYPPGVRENGGQYTHGATWAILALARMGKPLSLEERDEASPYKLP